MSSGDVDRMTRRSALRARRRRRALRRRLGLLLTASALVLSGSATALPRVRPVHATVRADPSTATLKLTDAQLAGQRIIYSYRGYTPPTRLLAQIRAGEAGGVILFAGNIQSPGQVRRVVGMLQSAAAHSPARTPLLIMTDQEGGVVRRLPGAPGLSEKQIGLSPHAQAAAQAAGRGAGRNLAAAGLNVNLAPVLDVYRSPGNFIDEFGRSYSNRASAVSTLGAAFIAAQQATGVAATAKHFPGLGAAARTQNTDEVPVTLGLSLASIRTVDEFPYRAAIAAGVKLVMVSWAVYPALDPLRPAGLSTAVVSGELRNRLRFRGVTVTDGLSAGALRAYGATGHRATVAAAAGMDLILCSSKNASEGIAAQRALAQDLSRGVLPRASFVAAVNRILALRQKP